jgi:hypothetical protein
VKSYGETNNKSKFSKSSKSVSLEVIQVRGRTQYESQYLATQQPSLSICKLRLTIPHKAASRRKNIMIGDIQRRNNVLRERKVLFVQQQKKVCE